MTDSDSYQLEFLFYRFSCCKCFFSPQTMTAKAPNHTIQEIFPEKTNFVYDRDGGNCPSSVRPPSVIHNSCKIHNRIIRTSLKYLNILFSILTFCYVCFSGPRFLIIEVIKTIGSAVSDINHHFLKDKKRHSN